MKELIYLDNNATTQIDKRVVDAMMPFLLENYGNASSAHHFGLETNKEVELARKSVANLINADSKEIVFTSGATESINIALKGIALDNTNSKKHIITLQTEHKAVLDTCKYLESIGFNIEYLAVESDGLLDIKKLKKTIREDTFLICIMWVNNETGVIQSIKEISQLAKSANIKFVCDATQAIGKIPININDYNIDAMCFSAHKFYGPKGVGALYLNKDSITKKNLSAILHGGGHESGLRSGTLNVPAIIGFAESCKISSIEMENNRDYILELRNALEHELLKIDGASINGNNVQRLYNTTNIYLPNLDVNLFIGMHKNIAVSNGSACTSALVEPSHVLSHMGLSNDKALNSMRVSIGKTNSLEDIQTLIKSIKEFIN